MNARQALVDYYRLLRAHGYNDSHSGNGSVRVEDTVWVTPTGASGDTLTVDGLVACPLDGAAAAGASVDAALHLAVYRASPGTGAVLHSHGPHAIALSLLDPRITPAVTDEGFSPVDLEGRLLFPHVPIIDVAYADHVTEAPARVAGTLATYPAAILRGHGIYAWGETLDQAYRWNSSVEASARIAWLVRAAGGDIRPG